MAAFEKTRSGIPAMDDALHFIRLGDNVVWQVSSLEEFRAVAVPFAEQAVRDGRNLLYIRFAEHEPILPEMEGLRIVHVPLSHRFETFTVEIHNIIEKEGYDAFYVLRPSFFWMYFQTRTCRPPCMCAPKRSGAVSPPPCSCRICLSRQKEPLFRRPTACG